MVVTGQIVMDCEVDTDTKAEQQSKPDKYD